MSGEYDERLHPSPPPLELAHTIYLFNQVQSTDWQELQAFEAVTNTKLARYEIDSMRAIEQARKRVLNG